MYSNSHSDSDHGVELIPNPILGVGINPHLKYFKLIPEFSKDLIMAQPRIQVPPNTLRITCPDARRRRFTTKENEEKIRFANEDRKAKLDLRSRRRQEKSAAISFSEEVEIAEGELEIKECLLRELARQENSLKGLSGSENIGYEKENERQRDLKLQRLNHDTMEALMIHMKGK